MTYLPLDPAGGLAAAPSDKSRSLEQENENTLAEQAL